MTASLDEQLYDAWQRKKRAEVRCSRIGARNNRDMSEKQQMYREVEVLAAEREKCKAIEAYESLLNRVVVRRADEMVIEDALDDA